MGETLTVEFDIEDSYATLLEKLRADMDDPDEIEDQIAEALGPQVEDLIHQSFQRTQRQERAQN